ncbi:MAG: sulfopyruvate decarboxylase subunit beta [Armatimonadetes bacterium]|nr:sulfopyruvate decarboxylase subunit beta [Armatimonadota bacterium]
MKRIDAIRELLKVAGTSPILANLGTNTYDLYAAAEDRAQNFYMSGAMGSVSSIGVGLAVARSDLMKVFVLDGDGSLLMNLGSLTTIAALSPPNLVHVMFDNRMYETTGRQASHTARGVNLAAIARAAGVRHVEEVDNIDAFARAVRAAVQEPGPWFVAAVVEPGASTGRVPRRPVYFKDRFMESLPRA